MSERSTLKSIPSFVGRVFFIYLFFFPKILVKKRKMGDV